MDDSNKPHYFDWFRPKSNFQERDPQLNLHVLEGDFDGIPGERVQAKVVDEMDENLWNQLSIDLIRRVLLRLPHASQYRFRAVCKNWLDMLSSTRFAKDSAAIRSIIPETPPICAYEYACPNRQENDFREMLLQTEPGLRIPDGGKELAQRLRAAASRSRPRQMQQIDLSFAPSWIMANTIIASRDGLICASPSRASRLQGPKSAHGGMCIINPFTRTWRELPPLPSLVDGKAYPWADEVMVDRASPSHFVVYVVMGTRTGETWFICQYSSKTSDWKTIPGESMYAPLECRSNIFNDGLLYSWKGDGRLLIHRLEDGNLVAELRPGYPVFPFRGLNVDRIRVEIVVHEGTIYAVWSMTFVGCWIPIFGISRHLAASERWEESVLLPEPLLHSLVELAEKEKSDVPEHWEVKDRYKVVVLGDYICFKLQIVETKHFVASENIVGFHIPSGSWKSFDIHFPHVLKSTDIELFVPRCLHVHL